MNKTGQIDKLRTGALCGRGDWATVTCAGNDCEVRFVEQVTEGAACTVLLARDLIEEKADLEQVLSWNGDRWNTSSPGTRVP